MLLIRSINFKHIKLNQINSKLKSSLNPYKCNFDHVKYLSNYGNRFKMIKNEQKQRLQNKKENLRTRLREQEQLVKQKIDGLKENIFTIPNALTTSRILMTPFLSYFILNNHHNLAFITFTLAGITDLLDGYIARKYPKQRSSLGSILDPIADKLLISTMFISLTINGTIPLYLTGLIFTRDLILLSCGSYIRYLSIPKPRTVNKFFDLRLATVQISPTFLSKINTAIQLTFIAYSLLITCIDLELFVNNLVYFDYFCKLTALSTVVSGLSYLFTKDTYKFRKLNK